MCFPFPIFLSSFPFFASVLYIEVAVDIGPLICVFVSEFLPWPPESDFAYAFSFSIRY